MEIRAATWRRTRAEEVTSLCITLNSLHLDNDLSSLLIVYKFLITIWYVFVQ
jgi:hypothetical protein